MSTRGGEDWEPRFGRGRIVQTLVGSRSREIIQARLDQLSTYGLLKSEGVAYLNQLMRELQDAGMLISSGGQYPMVTLTKLGEEVMKGRTDYELHWPQRSAFGLPEKTSQRKAKATSELAGGAGSDRRRCLRAVEESAARPRARTRKHSRLHDFSG